MLPPFNWRLAFKYFVVAWKKSSFYNFEKQATNTWSHAWSSQFDLELGKNREREREKVIVICNWIKRQSEKEEVIVCVVECDIERERGSVSIMLNRQRVKEWESDSNSWIEIHREREEEEKTRKRQGKYIYLVIYRSSDLEKYVIVWLCLCVLERMGERCQCVIMCVLERDANIIVVQFVI